MIQRNTSRRRRLGEGYYDTQYIPTDVANIGPVPGPVGTLGPGLVSGTVVPGAQALNLPADTPLSADPNAPSLVAAQAISNPPGSWAASTGYGYGLSTPPAFASSAPLLSLTGIPWYFWLLGGVGLVLALKR